MKKLVGLSIAVLLASCGGGFNGLDIGSTGSGGVSNVVSQPDNTDSNLPATCKYITRKTCRQIKLEYQNLPSSGNYPAGCLEAQQQYLCGNLGKDGDDDGFICDNEFNHTCPTPSKSL